MHTISENKLLMICPENIFPSSDRPRTAFDESEMSLLSESIMANGIIEPITVRRDGKNRYVLISGERRLKAAKSAGLRRVPCIVHKTDEKGAAIYSLIENTKRSNLNFFEEAEAINRLIGVYGMTQTDMALRLGMAQSAVSEKLKLLKINDADRKRILSAELTERQVYSLLKLDKNDMGAVLDTVIGKRLNSKQTEDLVNAVLYTEPQSDFSPEPVRKSAIGDVKLFSNSLSKLLDTMKNSGIEASSTKNETEDYIEYEVRIEKNANRQLAFSMA